MKEKKAKEILNDVKTTYDEIAEEFSNTRVHPGKEFPLFKKYIQKGMRIADLGCGNGRAIPFLEKIYGRGISYTGIDNSDTLLKIAQNKYPHHRFLYGDQLSIPLKDKATDVVLNIRAFHHIPSLKLRVEALEEVKRILKPRGILILSVWNLWQKKYAKNLVAAAARSFASLGAYDYNDVVINWGKNKKRYYHAFTRRELKKLLKQGGFKILEFRRFSHDYIVIAVNG